MYTTNGFIIVDKCYIHNIVTTNLKWVFVISCYWWVKNNLSGGFKLEPIITYHLRLVAKVLWNVVDITFSLLLGGPII